MRRHKRSMESRAYNRGYRTGLAGRSREICPHEKTGPREQWLAGWSCGHADYLDGYTGVAALGAAPEHQASSAPGGRVSA